MDGGSAANAQRRIAAGDPAVRVDSAVKPGAKPRAYYGKAEGTVSLGLRPEFSKPKTMPVHCFKERLGVRLLTGAVREVEMCAEVQLEEYYRSDGNFEARCNRITTARRIVG